MPGSNNLSPICFNVSFTLQYGELVYQDDAKNLASATTPLNHQYALI